MTLLLSALFAATLIILQSFSILLRTRAGRPAKQTVKPAARKRNI